MTSNAISIQGNAFIEAIHRITSQALGGDLETAFAELHLLGLSEDQKAKIAAILKERPHAVNNDQAAQAMKQRIIVVAGGENHASAATLNEQASSSLSHVISSEQVQCISFADEPKSPFGNDYPCRFEFGGKHYQNATACFLAQQYSDQPHILDLFINLGPEKAIALAELHPLTKQRKLSWENPHVEHINKDDVLMHVQRAKFGQNPDLKKQLLATGGAYLVCQGHGLHLSDNFNGTGENSLGVSLMRLRGEYGGTGKAEPPDAYRSAMHTLQTRIDPVANALCSDLMGRFFQSYFSKCDYLTLTAVACLNKHWNNYSTEFWKGHDLKQLCPELTILDAQTQGVKCEDEPKISKPAVLKWAKNLCSHIKGKAGITQLTMAKGTTLNQLLKIATDEGMSLFINRRLLDELGDVSIEQTYIILITNSFFMKSIDKNYNTQKEIVEEHGCVMPSIQDSVALHIFTMKIFNKYLYEKDAWSFGRTSTHVRNLPICVGSNEPDSLYINFNEVQRSCGVQGQRKFTGPRPSSQ